MKATISKRFTELELTTASMEFGTVYVDRLDNPTVAWIRVSRDDVITIAMECSGANPIEYRSWHESMLVYGVELPKGMSIELRN